MSENEVFSALESELRDNSHTTPFSKVSAIIRGLSRLFDGGLSIDKAAVLAVVEQVWQTVVVPYDVPYIPEFVEKRIEKVAFASLRRAVEDLIDSFSTLDGIPPDGA